MSDLLYICDSKRHLICLPYSIDNLHKMAKDLSIRRHWFHRKKNRWHYDIPKKKIKDVLQKSIVVTPEYFLTLIKFYTEP